MFSSTDNYNCFRRRIDRKKVTSTLDHQPVTLAKISRKCSQLAPMRIKAVSKCDKSLSPLLIPQPVVGQPGLPRSSVELLLWSNITVMSAFTLAAVGGLKWKRSVAFSANHLFNLILPC